LYSIKNEQNNIISLVYIPRKSWLVFRLSKNKI
jgi:hypothetical protein